MNIWDEWREKRQAERKVAQAVVIQEQKETRRPMTEDEKRMARTLKKCSLRRVTYHTRLVNALVGAAEAGAEITERMGWTLAGLYYMYRRQHGDKNAKKPEGWQ